jgi:hypothetical protein
MEIVLAVVAYLLVGIILIAILMRIAYRSPDGSVAGLDIYTGMRDGVVDHGEVFWTALVLVFWGPLFLLSLLVGIFYLVGKLPFIAFSLMFRKDIKARRIIDALRRR